MAEAGDGFCFVTSPITDAELLRHLATIPADLGAPYETEVNLAALKWVENLAQKLIRGYVLAVDYGYSRAAFYAPERKSGTLRCRAGHRIIDSPLTDVGEVDITAHVDWTSVARRGEECGLSLDGFTDQHHFITGLISRLPQAEFAGENDPRDRRALQTLLHPEFLGRTFQFLALAKNIPPDGQLSGLGFARNPRIALGL